MNKILYMLRHSQSAGTQAGNTDRDRHLTTEGMMAAEQLGILLENSQTRIDLILCSSAQRARETALKVNETLKLPSNRIQFEDELYQAFPSTIWACIQRLPPEVSSALIVGHNPALSETISTLLNEPQSLAPCECVGLEWSAQWNIRPTIPCKELIRLKP